MDEPSSSEPESHRIRAALAPVVARVLRRHGREPVKLTEPAGANAPWFSLKDDAGAPLVLVAAHDHHVHFLLGRRGFVASRHWVEAEIDALAHWVRGCPRRRPRRRPRGPRGRHDRHAAHPLGRDPAERLAARSSHGLGGRGVGVGERAGRRRRGGRRGRAPAGMGAPGAGYVRPARRPAPDGRPDRDGGRRRRVVDGLRDVHDHVADEPPCPDAEGHRLRPWRVAGLDRDRVLPRPSRPYGVSWSTWRWPRRSPASASAVALRRCPP